LDFYHRQLKPIAEKILNAINQGDIKIISKGKYEITEELKQELEPNKIFLVKHPE
jgi:predicted DNA-binding protein